MSKTVTGSYILRPNSDISINHSASTSPAWQSVADDDPETKIYTNSTNDRTSTFGLGLYSGTIPSEDYTITSVEIHANHQADFTISSRGYFQYGYSMGGHSFTADQITVTNDDRIDHTDTETDLNISVSANSLPSNPQVWAQCHRKTTLTKWNVQVTQIYVVVNWSYEMPYIVCCVYDNTSDKRVSYGENVSLTPVQDNIESEINSADSSLSISETLNLIGYGALACPKSNTSNAINCIMSDPTMACAWGEFSLGDISSDGTEVVLQTFEKASYLLDGGSGIGMDFGQLQYDYQNYVVCVLFDAKVYKGGRQMLPIARPIYVGDERVSSVFLGMEFMYGFYGYKYNTETRKLESSDNYISS